MVDIETARRVAKQFEAELKANAPAIGRALTMCVGGCELAAEPGDIFCQGCREGHERNRPLGRDW